MDVTLLRNRIQSTVDPNADVRRQAELDLRYVSFLVILFPECAKNGHFKAEEQPGFTNALLNILQAEQENSIRLSSTPSSYFAVNPLIYLQLLYISKTESLEHGNRAKNL